MAPPPLRHTNHHPTHITASPTHINHLEDNDDHSTQSEILLGSQSSGNPTPTKRRHIIPQKRTTYVKFTVPILSTIPTITTTLLHQLDSIEPSDQLSTHINHQLLTDSPPHPVMLNQKLIFVEITEPSPRTNQQILTTISSHWTDSFPTCTSDDPQSHLASNITLTPFQPPEWPQYCQVTTCPMHNNALPIVPNTPDGLHDLQLHVQHIHSDIFLSLPPDQLLSIGWSRCCLPCPSFFIHTSSHLTTHQNQCPLYHDATSTTTTAPNLQQFNYSQNPIWSRAFAICPPHKFDALNTLINDSPDYDDPETTLPNILMTVSQWCLESHPTTDTLQTATTNNIND